MHHNKEVRHLKNYIDTIAKNSMNDIVEPKEIDLVISGGAFNIAYGYGTILYLKSLEAKNKIHINRISGCSAGSILALVYLSNRSINVVEMYIELQKCFRDNGKLLILRDLLEKIIDNLLEDETLLKKISGILFISRINISNGCQEVIDTFNTRDELLEAVYSSCFIPFFVDGTMKINNKYVDGIVPHLFNDSVRPTLCIDLMTFSKFHKMFITMKEVNPHSRIIDGANDASKLFNEGCTNGICSWLNKWSIYQFIIFRMKYLIGYTICALLVIISNIHIPLFISDSLLYKGGVHTIMLIIKDIIYKISSNSVYDLQ